MSVSVAYARRGCSCAVGKGSPNATQPPVFISLPEGEGDENEGLGEACARIGGGDVKWESGRGGMWSADASRTPVLDQEKRKADNIQGGSVASPAGTSAPAGTLAPAEPNAPGGEERRGLRRRDVEEVEVTAGARVGWEAAGAVAG